MKVLIVSDNFYPEQKNHLKLLLIHIKFFLKNTQFKSRIIFNNNEKFKKT
jgi:hypothetical protein